ncbi:MAG TPA: RNA 2',3'-cyclic phosphodiesterase [Candidatus Limnocylindrales bacterium]|nr:RNA 2',3'-cyclic phosphodiesterase [Candidatus Limnocylindrales bacterium]
MRAFIGIGLPPKCHRAIAEAVSPFRDRRLPVSWTPEGNLHLTLKFLGEIPSGRIEEIGALLRAAASDVPVFELSVEGAGGFPSLRAPRVLWIGIREPLVLVGKLQENMETMLSGAGFPREGRPFHPHITVGRVQGRIPPGWGEKYARALSGIPFGVAGVNSCQLYESRLSPGGATYTVLCDIPLVRGTEGAEREEREEKGK